MCFGKANLCFDYPRVHILVYFLKNQICVLQKQICVLEKQICFCTTPGVITPGVNNTRKNRPCKTHILGEKWQTNVRALLIACELFCHQFSSLNLSVWMVERELIGTIAGFIC